MNQTYKDTLLSFHYRINANAEENPQKLGHILSAASKDDIVVEDYRPFDLTKEVISIYADNPEGLEDLMEGERFVEDISAYTIGDSYNSNKRSSRSWGINCDCNKSYNPSDGCYDVCEGGGTNFGTCMDINAKNYGEEGSCKYSGQGWTTFQNIGNGVLSVVDKIGFDNVFDWLTGNDDNERPDNSGGTDRPPIVIQQEKTDWGKIALYGGGLLVLGIGIYFLVRKIK